jgi:hypothetical protein
MPAARHGPLRGSYVGISKKLKLHEGDLGIRFYQEESMSKCKKALLEMGNSVSGTQVQKAKVNPEDRSH